MNAALDPWRDARALAQRLDRSPARTFVLMGDGECADGVHRLVIKDRVPVDAAVGRFPHAAADRTGVEHVGLAGHAGHAVDAETDQIGYVDAHLDVGHQRLGRLLARLHVQVGWRRARRRTKAARSVTGGAQAKLLRRRGGQQPRLQLLLAREIGRGGASGDGAAHAGARDLLAGGSNHLPGLDEVLARNIAAGRLTFTDSWPEVAAFADVQAVFGSAWFKLPLIVWTFCFSLHLANGIRHLFWDAGMGFDRAQIRRSGWAVVLVTLLVTVAFSLVAIV